MTKAKPLQSRLEELCKQHNVEIMYAFGSRCRELKGYVFGEGPIEKTSLSDADIGVEISGSRRMSVKSKVELMIELEDFFDVNRVDLVDLADADPFVAANVIRGERLYAEDTYRADEYDLYVLRRAGDLAHFERERLRLIFGESA